MNNLKGNQANDNQMKDRIIESIFATLNRINVNEYTEQKNGLTYLSWAYAWGELLKHYPDATYRVYENQCGWCYHTDGRTCWVKTGVTVEGKEYIELLPIMDYRNKAIPLESVTSTDVNKAIQRSLTKAVARHGLGLYIYAGEDLPACERESKTQTAHLTMASMDRQTGTTHRTEAVRALCKQLSITEQAFGQLKRSAVEEGVIEDQLVSRLTEDAFEALVRYVREKCRESA